MFACCILTDLQLSLDAVLAAVTVLGLRGVVFSHHLDKLTRQRRVLHDSREEKEKEENLNNQLFCVAPFK